MCCGPVLHGEKLAADAEQLMRSRYCAYVVRDLAYLRASWHPSTCPADLDQINDAAGSPKWIGLKVLRHVIIDDEHALVEFVARYRIAGRGGRLHENSRFQREHGRWLYVDGEIQR